MNRRDFLPKFLTLATVPLAADIIVDAIATDPFVPTGHLKVGEVGSWNVDKVTLNGVEVPRVVELDDVEGYVVHIVSDSEGRLVVEDGTLRRARRTGVVRVTYRKGT